MPTVQPHHNYGLFSDRYLDATLLKRSEWERCLYYIGI